MFLAAAGADLCQRKEKQLITATTKKNTCHYSGDLFFAEAHTSHSITRQLDLSLLSYRGKNASSINAMFHTIILTSLQCGYDASGTPTGFVESLAKDTNNGWQGGVAGFSLVAAGNAADRRTSTIIHTYWSEFSPHPCLLDQYFSVVYVAGVVRLYELLCRERSVHVFLPILITCVRF